MTEKPFDEDSKASVDPPIPAGNPPASSTGGEPVAGGARAGRSPRRREERAIRTPDETQPPEDLKCGVLWPVDDLEPRKRAEAALSLLDSALESTTDGILVVDRKGGITKWNRRFLELWGIPDDLARKGNEREFIDNMIGQVVEPKAFMDRIDELYANPEMVSNDRIELAGGRFFERYGHPQRLGEEIVGRVWWFRDVTKRWIAERALQEGETRLRSITDSTQDAIIMMDHRGLITFWNPAAVNILGYRSDEAIGQNLHELLAPERFMNDHRTAFPDFLRTGRGKAIGKTVELAACRKDGREIVISLSLSSVALQNRWHAVGIIRDITDQKQAEKELLETNRRLWEETARANRMAAEAEAANVAKSEFLANMSHEIRTPMNGIIGMTGLLLDTNLDEEQRGYVEIVRSSSETLLSLVNQILDFSKIEARRLELETMDFDLEHQVADFAANLAYAAHDKGLEFVCAIDPQVPTRLRGDPGRLRQILSNLAGNAIKFTRAGEVAVRVALIDEAPASVRLRFSVSDTGIGIPAKDRGDLFHPFTQVDASTTRKFGGTGLGLAISRQLAEMMGGEIGLENRSGDGSTFWFTVQLEKQAEMGHAAAPRLPAMEGVKLLIVDDNATVRGVFEGWTAGWGMRPCQAVDGAGALKALGQAVDEKDPFQAALIDLSLPGMDGSALCRAIRSEERLAATRLVLLATKGGHGQADHGTGAGFDARLSKPVRQIELQAVLSMLLDREGRGAREFPVPGRDAVPDTLRPAFADREARILIAEDNYTNQQVALGMISKMGLRADAVADGREALDALAIIPYDLVLMDVQMPEMDGLEATRRIRDPGSDALDHRVPVIALTAHALAGDRDRCLQAGMNGYLSKPVAFDQLADLIDRWLPRRPDRGAGRRQPAKEAAPPAETAASVWDQAALLDRLMGDDALLTTIVDAFLVDMPQQIQRIDKLLKANAIEPIVRQAHQIKGAAANVGGLALSRAALDLENAARTGSMGTLEQKLRDLADQFGRLREIMEARSRTAGVPTDEALK